MVADLTSLEDAVRRRAAEIADAAADIVVTLCKADCPVSQPTATNDHSGRLRDSLAVLDTSTAGNVETRTVGSDEPYAQFTDEVDTAAHPIEAVNVRHLRFWWDRGPTGAHIYFLPHVNHPGTRGTRWFSSQNPGRWQTALESAAGT